MSIGILLCLGVASQVAVMLSWFFAYREAEHWKRMWQQAIGPKNYLEAQYRDLERSWREEIRMLRLVLNSERKEKQMWREAYKCNGKSLPPEITKLLEHDGHR